MGIVTNFPKKEEVNKYFAMIEVDGSAQLYRVPIITKIRNGFRSDGGIIVNTSAANTKQGYCRTKLNGRCVKVHTIIWILCNGDIPDGYMIDHIDGNRTNNAIANLRLVTAKENQHNRKEHRQGKALGVQYDPIRKKWKAQARLNRNNYYLGSFFSKEEAVINYNTFIANGTTEKLEKIKEKSKSRLPGIRFKVTKQKWVVTVKIDNKYKQLGSFSTKEEAYLFQQNQLNTQQKE